MKGRGGERRREKSRNEKTNGWVRRKSKRIRSCLLVRNGMSIFAFELIHF
jgi:hypothetical protein